MVMELLEFYENGEITKPFIGDIHVMAEIDLQIRAEVKGRLFVARNSHVCIHKNFQGSIYGDVGASIEMACSECEATVYINKATLLICSDCILNGSIFSDEGILVKRGTHHGLFEEMAVDEQVKAEYR